MNNKVAENKKNRRAVVVSEPTNRGELCAGIRARKQG